MSDTAGRWERLAETGVVAPEPDAYGRRRLDMWAVVVGVLVLVVSAIVVSNGTVGRFEEDVFHAINDLPDFLEAPMWVFQLVGLLAAPLLFALFALALGRRWLGGALMAAVPLKLLLERGVVKVLVERERPGSTISDVTIRGVSAAGLSFPSGHAVLAFTIAGLVAPYLTRTGRILIYTIAALNGLARIYLGAHNPLDIVGGAALGIALAGALNLVVGVPLSED